MRTKRIFTLDPRTKFFMMLLMALIVLSRIGGDRVKVPRIILTFIPYILLLLEGDFSYCLTSLAALGVSRFLLYVPHILSYAPAGACAMVVGGIFIRMIPTVTAGHYVIKSTKVSEFIAAMEKMHVSQKIIIPLSVIFRLLPTVKEEFQSIEDAMGMRGIRLGGNKASDMIEYRLIPLVISSVRIGEDLSAAAITRGLASGKKRTSICKVRFHFMDYIFLTFFALTAVLAVLYYIGV